MTVAVDHVISQVSFAFFPGTFLFVLNLKLGFVTETCRVRVGVVDPDPYPVFFDPWIRDP
jgi:hypothetical protein